VFFWCYVKHLLCSSVLARKLAGMSVSEMTSLVLCGTKTSVPTQSISTCQQLSATACFIGVESIMLYSWHGFWKLASLEHYFLLCYRITHTDSAVGPDDIHYQMLKVRFFHSK